MKHPAPHWLFFLIGLAFSGSFLYAHTPAMELTVQIYNAHGEAVTDAEVLVRQADGQKTLPVPYDAHHQAYHLAAFDGPAACVVARHRKYKIDDFCWDADAPLSGVLVMSAGTKADAAYLSKGRRLFHHELPGCIAVQLPPETWQNADALHRLETLTAELGLEKMDFPRGAVDTDPFERNDSYKLAYRCPRPATQMDMMAALRASALCTGVSALYADGGVRMPTFSVETDAHGLQWLQQRGFEPQADPWLPGTYTCGLTLSQEMEFDKLCEEMAKSKLFQSFWQNSYR
jgi:hypothetical protein